MKKQTAFTPAIIKERLKLYIAAHCRSDMPIRNKGMEVLAKEVGVYTNPKTIEMDLFAYVDQIDSRGLTRSLFDWARSLGKEKGIGELPPLPQFQIELV